MKRRRFIGIAAAGAAGMVCSAEGREREPLPFRALAAPHLLNILHDERVVRDLGRRYRQSVPAEDNARALAEAILAEPHATAPVSLRAQVEEQVRRDFDGGRTVTLNGWILSLTEARQCALYSLIHD